MNRGDSFFRRVVSYWFADRGIGQKSRFATIGDILWLRPLWHFIGKNFKKFFKFEVPSWATNAKSFVYSPKAKTRWHDWVNPIYWIVWLSGLIYEMVVSRPYLSLGPAFPALVVGILLGGLGLRLSLEGNNWRTQFYQATLSDASRNGDYKLAKLAVASLVKWNPNQVELRVQQALIDEKLGDKDAATKAMARLALEKQNATAAFWLVKNTFSLDDLQSWSSQKKDQYLMLLETVIRDKKSLDQAAARTILAQYLAATGAPAQAASILERIAVTQKDLSLATAYMYSQAGNKEKTKYWAELSIGYYEERLIASPRDDNARLELARAMLLVGREEEAARGLSEGYRITLNPKLLDAGGEAVAAWSNRVQLGDPGNPATLIRRLQLLKKAVELAPKNGLVLESLVNVSIQCAENENAEIQTLRKAMLEGISQENLHFIQGTVDLLQGRIESANAHLELAAVENENLPGVLNNMAVVLYQRTNPDLDRALVLANAAIEKLPDHPYLRETRGQIYLRLGNYEKSIVDLEAALVASELGPAIHKSLAVAYEQLGQPEQSELHLRKSKSGKEDAPLIPQ